MKAIVYSEYGPPATVSDSNPESQREQMCDVPEYFSGVRK